jgi:hypothetical protein
LLALKTFCYISPIAQEIDNAKRITGDDFRSIILHFFQLMGIETKHLISFEASQKFRISNKICEELSVTFLKQYKVVPTIKASLYSVEKLWNQM